VVVYYCRNEKLLSLEAEGVKIGIVGFGAATIGFLSRIKDSNHEVHVFEKSKDVHGSSISGIRSDGKLFISSSMGGDIEIPIHVQESILDFYLSMLPPEDKESVRTGVSFDSDSRYFQAFYSKGFEPVYARYWHIGTDKLAGVLQRIYDEFSSYKNLHFHFGSRVEDIELRDNSAVLSGEDFEAICDVVFIAVGRSGHDLIRLITRKYPQIVLSSNTVDIGVRYELPDHVVQHINEEMYEFKVRLRTRTGYLVRTFCNNPSGTVVLEDYGDFVTVNGHSNSGFSSSNTNFAVLCTTSFTEPFNDPIGYGSYISRLSNILAGGRKVIVQTFRDFLESKRTKRLGRVYPTLGSGDYILGDINLVIPRRIALSLTEFINRLNEVIPGIGFDDNLMYAVEAKFYSNKLDNRAFERMKFIGDCSGHTRSITYATSHGIIEAEKLM